MPVYQKLYKTLPFHKLIDVLENAHQYEPEAVITAWSELERRGISKQEILDRRRALAARTEAQRKVPRSWLGDLAPPGGMHHVLDRQIRAVEPRVPTAWILNGLIALMAFFALMQVFGLFASGLLFLQPAESLGGYTVYVIFIGSVAAVFCSLAAFRLWQGRHVGWTLSTAFLVFQLLTPVFQVFRYTLFGTSDLFVAQFERVFLHDALTQLAVGVFLYGPPLYFLLLGRIRATFGVSQASSLRTVLIATAVLLMQKLVIEGF